MVFAELLSGVPLVSANPVALDSLPNEPLFLIDSVDPWYGDILIYLQTQRFQPDASKDDRRRIRHQAQHHIILGDALNRQGVDMIMCRCVTLDESDRILNDCHLGAYGGHLFGLDTAQKILCAGYFWPTIFKDCMTVVWKCHRCQLFSKKMCAHPTPLHPIVLVGPFAKWGIDFTTCKPPSTVVHNYIIVVVDYFTK
jgi:hypothetical protein